MMGKNKIRQGAALLLALAAGALPFAAPERCTQALEEGLCLCSGPLLLSLFPFLIVSALLIQCPAADVLGLPFRPAARLAGVRAPAAGKVMLMGFLGGFAPAAAAAARAVETGQLAPEEADDLLPACVCSGPSFVVLTVGRSMLGSTELGVLLFLAQVAAGWLSAALLARSRARQPRPTGPLPYQRPPCPAAEELRLDRVVARAARTYGTLCAFVLFFRMLAAGAAGLLPAGAGTLCAMLLEVYSGCDLAARSGRFASTLCCAALSFQGLSVLLQVRTICPPQMTLAPLYRARLLHLPLSVLLFHLLLPQGAQQAFGPLQGPITTLQRLHPDHMLVVFLGCSYAVCELSRTLAAAQPEPKRPQPASRRKLQDRP